MVRSVVVATVVTVMFSAVAQGQEGRPMSEAEWQRTHPIGEAAHANRGLVAFSLGCGVIDGGTTWRNRNSGLTEQFPLYSWIKSPAVTGAAVTAVHTALTIHAVHKSRSNPEMGKRELILAGIISCGTTVYNEWSYRRKR